MFLGVRCFTMLNSPRGSINERRERRSDHRLSRPALNGRPDTARPSAHPRVEKEAHPDHVRQLTGWTRRQCLGRSQLAVLSAATLLITLAACGGNGTSGPSSASRSHPSTSSTVPSTTTTTSPRPVPVGTLGVGVRTDIYVDASRPTPPNGNAPGSPTRSMSTTIFYPASAAPMTAAVPNAPPDLVHRPYPLVVFAHGFEATPSTYTTLLSRWASAGYVVVAPALPLLNGDAPGGPSHADYGGPNIMDLDFALGEAVRRAGTAADPLAGLIDPNRIAVAGHSDGEVLAYALGFEACCHDPRVKAVIPMAGNLANAQVMPTATGVPVLHIMNDHDEYDAYSASIAFDRQYLPAPHDLLTLVSETHAPAFTEPSDPHFDLVVQATVDFLDGALKGRTDGAAALQSLVSGAPSLATLETAPAGAPAP